jgi:hypothetical protein
MSPSRSRGRTSAPLVAEVIAVGLLVWVVGVFATLRATEDSCLGDLDGHPAYGSYEQTVSWWPPRVTCVLRGVTTSPIAVDHQVLAYSRFAAVFIAPFLYSGVGIVVVRTRGRPSAG